MGEDTMFSSSWDRTAWIVTAVYVLAFVVVTVVLMVSGVQAMGQSRVTGTTVLVLAGLAFGILVLTACLAPLGYGVTPDCVVVRRAGPDVRVALSEVSGVEFVDRETTFRRSIRTLASGGAFGYFGSWHSPGLGDFTAYVTRRDRLVRIDRKVGDPIVLSPDMPEEFIRMLRDRLARAAEPGARA